MLNLILSNYTLDNLTLALSARRPLDVFARASANPKRWSAWDGFRNFLLETAENVPETGQIQG